MKAVTKSVGGSLIGIAVAAGAVYLFDSENGPRRRERLRASCADSARRLNEATRPARDDIAHRFDVLMARPRAWFGRSTEGDVGVSMRVKRALARERARAGKKIGAVVHRGNVILHGDIAPEQRENVLRVVRAVAGVSSVSDHLIEDENALGAVGAKSATPSAFVRRFTVVREQLMQEKWSPATRAVAGTAGGALLLWGARQRDILSGLFALLGAAFVFRSTTNIPLKRAVTRRSVAVRKTLVVEAPVQRVFGLLADFRNFPRFMRNLREVKRVQDGTVHWHAAGPVGAPLEWDSKTTLYRPNEVLAWKSAPNSSIEHLGYIIFQPIGQNRTRVDIDIAYRTPWRPTGHAATELFGAQPKKELKQYLDVLKQFIETADAGLVREAVGLVAATDGGAADQSGRMGHRAG